MYRKGVLLAFITAGISGISIFSNSIFVSKVDPLIFALVRNACVAILLSAVLIGSHRLNELIALTKKQWLQLLVIGAIGGGIPFALFFTGLAQIGGLNGNVLNKTLFIWVALLAVPVLHEKIRPLQIAGYLILFVGMFLVGGTFTFIQKAGSWLVLFATILWSLEYIISKIALKRLTPQVVGWGRIVFGLPFLLAAVFLVGKGSLLENPASYALAPIAVSSILLVFYILSWYSALKAAPATLVSSILVVAPIVTALLALVIQGKGTANPQVMSFGLLIVGAVLVSSVVVWFKREVREWYDS